VRAWLPAAAGLPLADSGARSARLGAAALLGAATAAQPRGAEARTGASKGRPRVVVVDLRRSQSGESISAALKNPAARESGEQASRQPGSETAGKDFGSMLREQAGSPAPSPARTAAPPAAEPLLPERLFPEIVRHTGIILKEGNSGEIRLVLRPEHLGQVRVRLSLGESSLEGRILVENESVRQLLEAGLEELKQALRQEGFQTASLDVSVADRRSDSDKEAASGLQQGQRAGRVSQEFERAVPVILDWNAGSGLVNVYA